MKNLMRYALRVSKRRMTAFYLLPQQGDKTEPSVHDQLELESIKASRARRPRSLRENFAEVEYENDDESA